MSTTTPSPAALTVIEPTFSETEKLALAGFLAGYSGMTRTLLQSGRVYRLNRPNRRRGPIQKIQQLVRRARSGALFSLQRPVSVSVGA